MSNELVVLDTFRCVAFPSLLADKRIVKDFPVGTSLADVVKEVQPKGKLRKFAQVSSGGKVVARQYWKETFPTADDSPVIMKLIIPQGGGGVWRMVLQAVVLVIAAVLSYFVGPWVMGLAVVALTAFNIAFPPPVPKFSNAIVDETKSYSLLGTRNAANPWGMIPQLFGTMRIVPNLATDIISDRNGSTNTLRAVFCISSGLTNIWDIRIGSTPIGNYRGVTMEFRRGWHQSQINWRGYWDIASGYLPTTIPWDPQPQPNFGDSWGVV